jgi:hypothetical protein
VAYLFALGDNAFEPGRQLAHSGSLSGVMDLVNRTCLAVVCTALGRSNGYSIQKMLELNFFVCQKLGHLLWSAWGRLVEVANFPLM